MSRTKEFVRDKDSHDPVDGENTKHGKCLIEETLKIDVSFREALLNSSFELLKHSDCMVVRNAIQVIGYAGKKSDTIRLKETVDNSRFEAEVTAAVQLINLRQQSVEKLSEEIKDLKSVKLFFKGLADRRLKFQENDTVSSENYCIDGAAGWENIDISSFVFEESAFDMAENSDSEFWRSIADLLYCQSH